MEEQKVDSQRDRIAVKMAVASASTGPGAVSHPGEIVLLNVGGKRFSTSRQTLTWIQDSFFSSLMSGRIPSLKDETGAIFIDRDPDAFVPILNFMRTRSVDLRNVDIKILKHEAEFYGIIPLVKRLAVCDELEHSSCGSLLFYCRIDPPVFDLMPTGEEVNHTPQPQLPLGLKTDFSRQVLQITGHGNCIAAAYNHCICVFNVRESRGWDVLFTTPPLERVPQRIALNTTVSMRAAGAGGSTGPVLAAVLGNEIKAWSCSTSAQILASFDMKIPVDGLFFIGMQLVAISNTGKVAVWQSVQKHWQLQDVEPICSYDMAASFLLLGCTNGSIYYIDMEKFPVRMKDNDLLVTQLFEDPCKEPITALSVYFTPNVFPGSGQNWMEVAYGTRAGKVRVVVRHPENIGQAPQIFQTYSVHTCPIMRVVLGEKHLISVCAENHVRSWTVTRFRGRISTQPGSTPIASFKVLSLEGAHSLFYPINSIGPFGERDEEQVFIQRVIPETSSIFIRHSSTGNRVCKIESVDSSNISSYCVHECEGINRTGLRSRRFIFTGHLNGSIQVWDLTTALELSHKNPENVSNGPTKEELLDLLQNCDMSANSRVSSVVSSRAPSPSPSLMSIMYPGLKPAQPSTSSSTTATAACGAHHIPSVLSRLTVSNSASQFSAYDNLFQPIRVVSQSPSTNSISSSHAAAATVNANVTHEVQGTNAESEQQSGEQSKGNETQVSVVAVERGSKLRPGSVGEDHSEAGSTSNEGDTAQLSNKVEELQNNRTKSEHDIPEGLQVHQRSRSNEIDYSSVGYESRMTRTISAFRSPPGTMRGFRPHSVDSARGSLLSDVTDSLSSTAGGDSMRGTTSSKPAAAAVPSTHRSDLSSSSSEATVEETVESATGQAATAIVSKETETSGMQQLSSSTLDWLKDFDYFSSSDEPKLKITDC